MKKIISLVLVLMFVCTSAFAVSYGIVKDNNNGKEGQILINTGIDSGSTDIGTWVDPSSISGLKGEKGDRGERGIAGRDGRDGVAGINGKDGEQGIQGIKGDTGTKGTDGINGSDGKDGMKGDTGNTGKDVDTATVDKFENEINTNKTNTDMLNGKVNDLEKTQAIIGIETRIYDGKKWVITTFADYTTTRQTVDSAGVRFTYKLGKSYTDKKLEELEARLDNMDNNTPKINTDKAEIYTEGNGPSR
jgi:hypothetical protein